MVDDIKVKVAFDDTSSTSSSSSSNDPDPMARIRSIFAVKSTKSIRLKKEAKSKPLMLKPSQSISSSISIPQSKHADVQHKQFRVLYLPFEYQLLKLEVLKATNQLPQ